MKLPGYQVIDVKISELPQVGRSYLTCIIEIKGCRFAQSVEIDFDLKNEDPFATAQTEAIRLALKASDQSDCVLYGRNAPRAFGGGGKKGPDPNAPATEGQRKRLFAIGKNECGYTFSEIEAAIKKKGLDPHALTVGQVNGMIEAMQANPSKRKAAANATP